jgi:hypothetical protein
LLFRGSRDGWTAKIIHAKIDNQGPTITIIKTLKGKIFGGFASVSWEGEGHKTDNDAFLFSVDLGVKNTVNHSSEEEPITPIYCTPEIGPFFGQRKVFCIHTNANINSDYFYVN